MISVVEDNTVWELTDASRQRILSLLESDELCPDHNVSSEEESDSTSSYISAVSSDDTHVPFQPFFNSPKIETEVEPFAHSVRRRVKDVVKKCRTRVRSRVVICLDGWSQAIFDAVFQSWPVVNDATTISLPKNRRQIVRHLDITMDALWQWCNFDVFKQGHGSGCTWLIDTSRAVVTEIIATITHRPKNDIGNQLVVRVLVSTGLFTVNHTRTAHKLLVPLTDYSRLQVRVFDALEQRFPIFVT